MGMIGEPVSGKALLGRKTLVAEILARARKPVRGARHILLAAPRKCGRTSLLGALAVGLAKRGTRVLSLRLGQPSVQALVEHGLAALARAAGILPGTAGTATEAAHGGPEAAARSKRSSPRLGGWARELEGFRAQAAAPADEVAVAERWLALLDAFQRASGESLWIVGDELEGLADLLGEAFLAGPFRAALGRNRKIRWLLAGSPIPRMERLASDAGGALSGRVGLWVFRGLSHGESSALLHAHGAPAGLPPALRSFLIALTGGHPFYLAVLAEGLEAAGRELGRKAAPEGRVLTALERELFAGGGRLNLYFSALLADSFRRWRAPELYQGMIEAVAAGEGSLVGISGSIRRDAPALSRQVQNLLDTGLVAKEGMRYFIPDPMFRLWLRHVQVPKRMAWRVGEAGIEPFREHFRALMAEYAAGQGRDAVGRLAQILRASDGKLPLPSFRRAARPDGTRSVLPRFNQVEAGQKVGGESFDLAARRGNEYWVFRVWGSAPARSALAEFSERLRRAQAGSAEGVVIHAVAVFLAGNRGPAERVAARLGIEAWSKADVKRLADAYGQLPVET